MDISEFLKSARDLTETLERFSVAFARYTAVTCLAGDGICIDFDRSDRFAATLHRRMLKAHPADRYVISYDPLNIIYESLPAASGDIVSDPERLRAASEQFKALLMGEVGETYYSKSDNEEYHVVYTETNGVCISAADLRTLEKSVFRTEEYAKMLKKRASTDHDIIARAGNRTSEAMRRHRILTDGNEYLKKSW